MTPENPDKGLPKFTGQEPVYGRTIPLPSEVLGVVFNSLTEPILNDPKKIAFALVQMRSLSCLGSLFPNPQEDNQTAESRVDTLVKSFIESEKTNGHLSVSNGFLKITRGTPDIAKSDQLGRSPWAGSVSMILGPSCKDALQYQTDLLREALQVSQ